jgi:hypothetical protein
MAGGFRSTYETRKWLGLGADPQTAAARAAGLTGGKNALTPEAIKALKTVYLGSMRGTEKIVADLLGRIEKRLDAADKRAERKEDKERQYKERGDFKIYAASEKHKIAAEIAASLGILAPGKRVKGGADLRRLVETQGKILSLLSSGRATQSVMDRVIELQETASTLREKIEDTNESIIERLDEARDNQKSYSDKYVRDIVEFRREMRDRIMSIPKRIGGSIMNRLDNIGMGPLTLGNAVRATRWVGGFAKAKAQDYVKTRRAQALVGSAASPKASPIAMAGAKPGSFILGILEGMTQELMEQSAQKRKQFASFAHSHLKGMRDVARAVKAGKGGMLSEMIQAVSSTATKIGGTVSSLMTALSPMLRTILGVLGPVGAVAGAAYGGWVLGRTIYEKFGPQIVDVMETVVGVYDKTVGKLTNTIESVVGFFKGKSVGDVASSAYEYGKSALSSGVSKAKSVLGGVGAAATGAADKVVSVSSNVAQSVATATEPARNTVSGAASAAITKGSEMLDRLVSKRGNADVDNLNPTFKSRFAAMAGEYKDRTGSTIPVNSGYRSVEEQRALYDAEMKKPASARKLVAKPGGSMHNYGFALDTDSNVGNKLESMGLLSKYGFERPIPNEKWHLQLAGVSKAAAQKGIFSADYVGDQSAGSGGPSASAPPVSGASAPSVSGSMNAEVAQGGTQSGGGSLSTHVPSSATSIPTFSTIDGSLLAMNMGAIGV